MAIVLVLVANTMIFGYLAVRYFNGNDDMFHMKPTGNKNIANLEQMH